MNYRITRISSVLVVFIITSTVILQNRAIAQISTDSTYVQPLKKEQLSTFERSFKPSFYDNEVYLFKKNDTAKLFGTSIDQVTVAPPETLQGFRVQLLSTNNYEEALSLRSQLNSAYPKLWIYTAYETPAYKIRIGDFINRSEAKVMVEKLQQGGYKSAWIVPDKVIINQPPKPPLPEPIDSTSFGQ